jgi:hypothetical protein
MRPAPKSPGAGEIALAPPASPVLDLLAAGRSIEAIADARNHTRARVEKIVRAELNAISIRPTRDYAKLQIRRLEAMVGKLIEQAAGGDLGAVDRILKVFDRLDRYHGFSKAAPTEPQLVDQAYEELMRKLADMTARRQRAASPT